MKYVVLALTAGLSFWAIERYAMKNGKFLDQVAFEDDDTGRPKLGVGYFVVGTAIVAGAVAAGSLAHMVSKRIPKGVAVAAA